MGIDEAGQDDLFRELTVDSAIARCEQGGQAGLAAHRNNHAIFNCDRSRCG